MKTRNWDEHWRRRAHLNAEMSTCMRRRVGAVAVQNRRSFADAYNGNVPGELHCDEGGCERCADASRPSGVDLDECVCVHAESNLVSYCAIRGISMRGATVYCTHRPCVHCTKLLASSGVVAVVYDNDYPAPNWTQHLQRMTIRRFGDEAVKPDDPEIIAAVLPAQRVAAQVEDTLRIR